MQEGITTECRCPIRNDHQGSNVRIAVIGHGQSPRQPTGMRRNRNCRLSPNSQVSNAGFERLRTPTNVGQELRLEDESYPEATSVMHNVHMHKASWGAGQFRERKWSATSRRCEQADARARGYPKWRRGEARVSVRKNSDTSYTSLYMLFPASKNRGDEL
jgi:hypothetical protein